MEKIEKSDEINLTIAKGFTIVSQVILKQLNKKNMSQPEINLILELSSKDSELGKLTINFFKVRNLQLNQPSLSLFQLIQLTCSSIEKFQWEDVNFKFLDEEDNSINFLCDDFVYNIDN